MLEQHCGCLRAARSMSHAAACATDGDQVTTARALRLCVRSTHFGGVRGLHFKGKVFERRENSRERRPRLARHSHTGQRPTRLAAPCLCSIIMRERGVWRCEGGGSTHRMLRAALCLFRAPVRNLG